MATPRENKMKETNENKIIKTVLYSIMKMEEATNTIIDAINYTFYIRKYKV